MAAKPVVYYNGNILPMEGDAPDCVEAVAAEAGKIAFVGTREGALAAVGEAQQIDLQMKLLGPERATAESPLASAVHLGLNATLHCDCPSASPNMMEAIGTAVTRTTVTGQVLGPEERVSAYTALLGATRNAAFFYREEAIKGNDYRRQAG